MYLLFLQNFWCLKLSINISLDTKLNFILRLFNRASQITTVYTFDVDFTF